MSSRKIDISTTSKMRNLIDNNYTSAAKPALKEQMKKNIRKLDRIAYCKRFNWYNLPDTITPELLERMLYFKWQLAFFYMKETDSFYILPFTLKGNLDCYGRWNEIIPLPFASNSLDDKGKVKPWIDGLSKKVQKDIPLNITIDDYLNNAVILRDYTQGLGESDLPTSVLQEAIIDYEAELLAMHRTACLNSTGINAIRVGGPQEVQNVYSLNDIVQRAALNGDKYVAVQGDLDFQNLDTRNPMAANELMQAVYSVDNLRLTQLGIDNGGIAEKNAHLLESELEASQMNTGSILEDGLQNRQEFCNMVNALWGLGIWCEINQNFNVDDNAGGMMPDDSNTNIYDSSTDSSNNDAGGSVNE